jgi:hypothetical protein
MMNPTHDRTARSVCRHELILNKDRRIVREIPAQDGRASIIWLVLVTKPKQNLTFQSVASRQKSGEVVPQQSSTSTQL